MVRGLEKFREVFSGYTEHFVLIGGTACTVLMNDVDIDFRATKDLDIVLSVEALDKNFLRHFWKFIEDGGYKQRQKSSGKKVYYRFSKPTDLDFPVMLELFSRFPDGLKLTGESSIIPIPSDEKVLSLSAILLEEGSYNFVHAGSVHIDGLPVAQATHLIPLKAQAWLDLTTRKGNGENVDSRDIRKHKNDIIRLFQLLTAEDNVNLPLAMIMGMSEFVAHMETSEPINFKSLGLRNVSIQEITVQLKKIYNM
ncbi:Uncharacterized protein SCG7109_AH_00040 [Chlamydiales bacterium SCGC AG-110-M15]|nr:Uncharacterized protein SCG7109_AH_00040 [Chlamydiales bacterium SCGC AG-110-M15]